MVEQPPAGLQHRGELLGVACRSAPRRRARPSRSRRPRRTLAGELAVVLNADLDPVGEARVGDSLPRQLCLILRERDADRLNAVALRRMHHEAAPATADVEHPLALLQRELRADEVELRLLGLLQGRSPVAGEKSLRLRDAGEEGAGVGHRLVEEEREELVADVVVVADGLAVALGGVLAAAEVDLGLRRGRRAAHAGGSHGCGDQPGLRRRPDRRRLPVVEQPDHGIHVVDLDRAGDVGAPQPELPGRRDRVGDRVLGAGPECGTASIRVGGGEPGAVPELDRERPLGEGALDLLDEWFRGHVPTLAPSRVQFRLGLPNSSPQR